MILLHLIKILLMQEWERKQEIQNLLYLWTEMERLKRDDVHYSYAESFGGTALRIIFVFIFIYNNSEIHEW